MATRIRFQIILATTLAAVMLYLDRVCMAEIAKLPQFRESIGLNETQIGSIMSAFFLTYALSQLPAGWLSDRMGARHMLAMYICIWSLCTLATGLATGFAMLLTIRLLFGISQAGCYPTASSLIRRWIAVAQRGTASAFVSFGGRIGGAIAPLLTASLLASGMSWRIVLGLYGCVGFLVAAYYWWICRETPEEHSGCDAEERQSIRDGSTEPHQPAADFPPILPLVKSGSMWMMSALQFGINVGWAFLVSWLPSYLREVKHLEDGIGGLLTTIALAAGVVGMLCGGLLTDTMARRFGKRWGRTLPMIVCYMIAAAAYSVCMVSESTYAFVLAVSIISFATDLSVPSIWAYMQDKGGKNTAAFFGWGNMWGNLGAAATAQLVPIILKEWDRNNDWHEAFLFCGSGYVVAAFCGLMIGLIDEERPASQISR